MYSEQDGRKFGVTDTFNPELVRQGLANFIENRSGRPSYPPGVSDNPEAVLWVTEEILKTPASPANTFRTLARMVEYMSDIEQVRAFGYLQGGRLLNAEDEVLVRFRERIIDTLQEGTPQLNTSEVESYCWLYTQICPKEWRKGRTFVERAIRRYKYGAADEDSILGLPAYLPSNSRLTPEQKIDYIKGQLPKLREYKARKAY